MPRAARRVVGAVAAAMVLSAQGAGASFLGIARARGRGFLSRRAGSSAAQGEQQREAAEGTEESPLGSHAYLPPPPADMRALPVEIPGEPVIEPLGDNILMTPVPTEGPPVDEDGNFVSLPPKGLEGWYATLAPRLVPGWAQGATDWEYRYYIRCTGGPWPCPYTRPPIFFRRPVTTTPAAPAPAPAPMPLGFVPEISFAFVVQSLDFAMLTNDVKSSSAFVHTAQLAISSQVGIGILPDSINITLSPGSVGVHVAYICPTFLNPDAVLSSAQAAVNLCNTVAVLLSAVPSIAGLATGPLAVAMTSQPVLTWVLPLNSTNATGPAPAPAPAAAVR